MSGYKHSENLVDIGEQDPMDFYARLAHAAYKGEDHQGKQEYIDEHIGDGWAVDQELSNMDRTVYAKPKASGDGYNVVMSNRGTDALNKTGNLGRNLMTDASIFFGTEPRHQRFKDAGKEFLGMREKYGTESNYSVGGHSLGGSVSVYLNRRFGVEGHHTNPGASFSHMNKGLVSKAMCWFRPSWGDCKQQENSTVYHQVGDVLSTASIMANDKKVLANSDKSKAGYNLHSTDQFFKVNQKKK